MEIAICASPAILGGPGFRPDTRKFRKLTLAVQAYLVDRVPKAVRVKLRPTPDAWQKGGRYHGEVIWKDPGLDGTFFDEAISHASDMLVQGVQELKKEQA